MVYLLYQARNGIDNQLNEDLAHNLIEQILIMGSMSADRVSLTSYKEDQDNFLTVKYKELIAEHFVREKAVKFYADRLNVTERRLTKATKQVVGVGAKELITDYMVENAKRQLIHTQRSVKEISLSLGFSGEQNFSAFFLKYTNMRPTEFRKRGDL